MYAQFGYGNSESRGADQAPETKRPVLLDRLPADKRGRLSHLTVQDHYVDVTTDRDRNLC